MVADTQPPAEPLEADQCIFLHYYKMKRGKRGNLWAWVRRCLMLDNAVLQSLPENANEVRASLISLYAVLTQHSRDTIL